MKKIVPNRLTIVLTVALSLIGTFVIYWSVIYIQYRQTQRQRDDFFASVLMTAEEIIEYNDSQDHLLLTISEFDIEETPWICRLSWGLADYYEARVFLVVIVPNEFISSEWVYYIVQETPESSWEIRHRGKYI